MEKDSGRKQRLLQEFWELCDQAGISRQNPQDTSQQTLAISTPMAIKKGGRKKLKEVRTEAIRIGFKACAEPKTTPPSWPLPTTCPTT